MADIDPFAPEFSDHYDPDKVWRKPTGIKADKVLRFEHSTIRTTENQYNLCYWMIREFPQNFKSSTDVLNNGLWHLAHHWQKINRTSAEYDGALEHYDALISFERSMWKLQEQEQTVERIKELVFRRNRGGAEIRFEMEELIEQQLRTLIYPDFIRKAEAVIARGSNDE